ncbi:ABC transporter permease [Agromyces albus]|uniref:ABC transporter permease n=1 Tax=Agromyces albus TaxID=205332 RepID=A0A4Q2KNV0_9MICO|nr:ABC transporter permease [Agromyces albus]RXZ67045.1 ABC transporter permease [Agromyces albus]
MISFILRRLGAGIILIFVVTTITFVLTYGANIPVARNILGPSATEAQVAALTSQLGLDRPLIEQYGSWISGLFQGDLGTSYFSSQPVAAAMGDRLPVTLSIVVLASILTLVISTVLGVASAVRGGALDAALQAITVIAYVFPGLVLGIVLVYVFAISLHWVPAIGFTPIEESVSGWFASSILPAVVLAIGGIAALAAQVRGSVIDELGRDYVRTLRSRDVSEGSILFKHVLRNAAGPAFTTFSLQFVSMFGAALFIERIFALPGYGTYAFTSTIAGDLPAMLGVTLFGVGLVVVVNLLVDLATGWLNPKARIS